MSTGEVGIEYLASPIARLGIGKTRPSLVGAPGTRGFSSRLWVPQERPPLPFSVVGFGRGGLPVAITMGISNFRKNEFKRSTFLLTGHFQVFMVVGHPQGKEVTMDMQRFVMEAEMRYNKASGIEAQFDGKEYYVDPHPEHPEVVVIKDKDTNETEGMMAFRNGQLVPHEA